MRLRVLTSLLAVIASAAAVHAQANPLSAQAKYLHTGMKMILLQSAERMPAEQYGFRPTEEVRTYGQLVAHIADMQYSYCSAILGEKDTMSHIEETKSSKPELIAALEQALAYCDRAVDGLTDASGAESVRFMGGAVPKLGLLQVATVHSSLHYGNLITYMRMKNVVPPTSDSTLMPPGTVHPLPKHPPQR